MICLFFSACRIFSFPLTSAPFPPFLGVLFQAVTSRQNHMNSHSNKPMMKKPRTVTASDHDHADCAALTLLFGNEHIILHLSLFVVLPLPYLCKACAQQGGSSFTSAHVYALSCHENHRKWASCRFSESRDFMMEIVKRQPEALRLASYALKNDREIVLQRQQRH